ncbi:dihydrofolate reductase family protein [Sinomicrobium soli]|uniref:dihydrofolate reductase family protein n=1 Tax=Sinomicrobium sp. N-1-3-6 TaxID=2219864 RepID=UPI001F362646|nr:dihydrofolate reductase family protein [Sinomicrobium sp. N-1-3-6]
MQEEKGCWIILLFFSILVKEKNVIDSLGHTIQSCGSGGAGHTIQSCGSGAEIVNELLKSDLIDEFIISIVPVLIGNGTRLFKDGRPEQYLELVNSKRFDHL